MKKKKYKGRSLVNNTGYTPGYETENNPINFIPSENITMKDVSYPIYGFGLDEKGNKIGMDKMMMPGQEYNFPGAAYVGEIPVPEMQNGGYTFPIITKKGNKLTEEGWKEMQKKGVWSSPLDYMDYVDGWAKPDEADVAEVAAKAFQNSPNAKANNYPTTQGTSRSANGSFSTYPITPKMNRAIDSTQFVNNYRLDNKIVTNQQNQKMQMEKLGLKFPSFQTGGTNYFMPPLPNLNEEPQNIQITPDTYNPTFSFPDLTGMDQQRKDQLTGSSEYMMDPEEAKALNDKYANSPVVGQQQTQGKQAFQFNNPYGDVDLNSSLMGLGSAIKSGDGLGIASYGANSLLKGAKSFLSGFGTESRMGQNLKDFYGDFRENITGENNATYMQEGGEVSQQEQLEEQIVAALEQGATEEQIIQQLISSGVPEDQATQMVQGLMQEVQAVAQEPEIEMEGEEQIMAKGGMIKRKDGSYSKRGLWDNIRKNRGSGKKPTKEMLAQERKIKAKYEDGGTTLSGEELKEKTGEYIFPLKKSQEDQATAEIEKGEYIMDSQGIRKAMGETHEKGGTKVSIEEGTKVLSDHLKVGGETAKQLSKELDVKINAAHTYAKVLDAYNKKSGLDEINKEIEGFVKLLEKQQKDVKNETTSSLNTEFLIGQIKKATDKKLPAEKERERLFNSLFEMQESSKKTEEKEDPLQYMENGGMIKDLAIKYNIPMDKVLELIPKYQNAGTVNNTNSTFTNAPANETFLPYTPISNTSNDLWQGENYNNKWIKLVEDSMSNTENARQIEDWLLNKTGEYGKNVKKQLEGLQGEERKNRIITLATDRRPGPFHNAFLQAVKETVKPAATTTEVTPVQKTEEAKSEITPFSGKNTEVEDVRGSLNLPVRPLNMPTWTPSLKVSTRLNEIDPALISPEQQIAENDRAVLAAQENLQELSPAQRALANIGLVAQQITGNSKAIQEANRFNSQAQNSANVYNARVADAEQQAENQNALNYEARTFKGLGAFENDMQNMINHQFRDQTQNWKAIQILNQQNALNPDVQFTNEGFKVYEPNLEDLNLKYINSLKTEEKPKKKYGGRFKKK